MLRFLEQGSSRQGIRYYIGLPWIVVCNPRIQFIIDSPTSPVFDVALLSIPIRLMC